MDFNERLSQIKQYTSNAYTTYKNEKLVSGSTTLLVVALLLIVMGFARLGGNFTLGLVCMAIGIYMLYLRHSKQQKQTDTYLKLVSSGCYDIKQLATRSNITNDVVVKHLQQMIDYGYFGNAFVDNEAQRIVFPDGPNLGGVRRRNDDIVCQSCGARIAVAIGQAAICEYCGTQVIAKGFQAEAAPTKFCKHCSAKIPIDAVVCTACGRQVEILQGSNHAQQHNAAQPQIIIVNENTNTNTNNNIKDNSHGILWWLFLGWWWVPAKFILSAMSGILALLVVLAILAISYIMY